MTALVPAVLAATASLLVGGACLDPMVGDEVPALGLVLPAGSEVPDAHDDPIVDGQIATHDGVDGLIPLLSGFAAGTEVAYWDFGPTPSFAAPVFMVVRRTEGGDLEAVDHHTIVDTIPGDARYSPYWAVWLVEVTDSYAGEIIPSVAAIQEAEELGLVLAPDPQPFAVNCPAVATGVTLQVDDDTALEPPQRFYWEGRTVRYYDFGQMPLDGGVFAIEAPMYILRREGGEPLSEPVRGVDMTGDGDIKDSNNLFVTAPSDSEFTPLCRIVEVVVPGDYQSIDTSGDQAVADFRATDDIFDPEPVVGNVVSYTATETLFNCPQQQSPGAR